MLFSTNRKKVLSRRLTFIQFWPITNFTLRIWAWKMEKTMASLQAFLSFLPRAPHALSRAQISPSPSPFNACHAGYRKTDITHILHINVVINWKLSKQGIHWSVSPDRIAGSGVHPSRWLCLNHTIQKDSRGVLGTSFRLRKFSKTCNMTAQAWWKLTAKGAVLSPEKRDLRYCWRSLRLLPVSFEEFWVQYSMQSFYKCLINLFCGHYKTWTADWV